MILKKNLRSLQFHIYFHEWCMNETVPMCHCAKLCLGAGVIGAKQMCGGASRCGEFGLL